MLQQAAKLTMMDKFPENPRIAVIGLGYVGLPLALALSRHFQVTGFDTAPSRIAELKDAVDSTGETTAAELAAARLPLSAEAACLTGHDLYILCVPTPVDGENVPDLSALTSACRTVGQALSAGAVVVIESTVYPGVTMDHCRPVLASASGLKPGTGFRLGYSPERINPGDRDHGLTRMTKVVAGETPAVSEFLAQVYGRITGGEIFQAADIATAEAAKVIENAQRDINIAFVNEVALICQRLGLSVHQVLEAAETKWNFQAFKPGLVGGHGIGVDPFYLAHRAREVGHQPDVILAGRRINDAMSRNLADLIAARLPRRSRVLVLGLTFKENVRDLRNSKVADLVARLEHHDLAVWVHDPMADAGEAAAAYDLALAADPAAAAPYDAIIPVVGHGCFAAWTMQDAADLLRDGGLVVDVKGIWRHHVWPASVNYWLL